MKKYVLILITIMASVSLVTAKGLKSSEVKDIAEQYVQAIESKDFNKWSQLMLSTDGINEETFKEKMKLAGFKSVEKIAKVKRTKTGYDILLQFEPQIKVRSESSNWGSSSYWIQMLPDGKIKYDILIPHPLLFATINCRAAIRELEDQETTKSGSHLKDYGIPLFEYDKNSSVRDQLKSLQKIKEWILDEGEEWDLTDPKVPFPEGYYTQLTGPLKQL